MILVDYDAEMSTFIIVGTYCIKKKDIRRLGTLKKKKKENL